LAACSKEPYVKAALWKRNGITPVTSSFETGRRCSTNRHKCRLIMACFEDITIAARSELPDPLLRSGFSVLSNDFLKAKRLYAKRFSYVYSMFNLIKSLFLGKANPEPANWKTENSIYNHLVSRITAEGKLDDTASELPDEQPFDDEGNNIKFAPGLFDAISGGEDTAEADAKIKELMRLLKDVAYSDNPVSQAELYHKIVSSDAVISFIDTLLEKAMASKLPVKPYLLSFAEDLAFHTTHRNSVKIGLALLGMCRNEKEIERIKILALHDEFTIFAVVALFNLSDRLPKDLLELAKKVDGWGRIQIIWRLADLDLSGDMKEWLLLEGYKNNIMYEYLAYTCAVKGDLHLKIQVDTISSDLYDAAGEIIDALIAGGPAEDISNYVYAALTVENFIRHSQQHAVNLSHFLTLTRIKDFLNDLQQDLSPDQLKNGWTQDEISNCLIDLVAVINGKDWAMLTQGALQSTDNVTYWNGKQAALSLGIDLWPIVWSRLKHNPADSSNWYDVAQEAEAEHADQLIQLAIELIPLKELATGPKDSLGLGPKYIKYQSLDYVIPFLENYPGKGEEIMLTALNSPVTRNRNLAIKVLAKWDRSTWTAKIIDQLKLLRNIEPNESTRTNVHRLLNGQELDFQ
jgi:hypothetical protein